MGVGGAAMLCPLPVLAVIIFLYYGVFFRKIGPKGKGRAHAEPFACRRRTLVEGEPACEQVELAAMQKRYNKGKFLGRWVYTHARPVTGRRLTVTKHRGAFGECHEAVDLLTDQEVSLPLSLNSSSRGLSSRQQCANKIRVPRSA